MAVSKRLRYEILRRDNHTCRYCGTSAPDVPLRVDHVVPVALGGADTADNLVTSCEPCNSGKSSMSADAALVTDVAESALHWAAAMKQAAEELRAQAEPKRAYRDHFQTSWNEWTREVGWKTQRVELQDGWKGSLDAFYEAGLPQEVWPDIIEKAMTNPTVRADNTFRYACGIAWRMVRELRGRAKEIAEPRKTAQDAVDSIVQAAIDEWTSNRQSTAAAEELEQFRASAVAARETEDAHRIVQAGQYAAWYDQPDISAALEKLDRDELLQKWTLAWLTVSGEWPDDEPTDKVAEQIDRLLTIRMNFSRIERAVIYAGSRRSQRVYFGLAEEELNAVGQHEVIAKAVETWVQAYRSTVGDWPTKSEVTSFFTSMRRIGEDGDIWINDIYQAAAAAGAYLDPEMATCLTRHLSVFEAAARPLAQSA